MACMPILVLPSRMNREDGVSAQTLSDPMMGYSGSCSPVDSGAPLGTQT